MSAIDPSASVWDHWRGNADRHPDREATVPPAAVASFERELENLLTWLRLRGVKPVVATYPTLVHPDNVGRFRYCLALERQYRVWFAEDGLLDATEKLNAAARRVADRERVPLADLDRAVPRTTDYFMDDVHYTDAGALRVAEVMRETLVGAGLAR